MDNSLIKPHHIFLIRKYKQKGLLIDTNILLLLLIGLHDPKYIKEFPKTAGYNEEEFQIIYGITQMFTRIYTTPYILSEITSSTHRKVENRRLSLYFEELGKEITTYKETYQRKNEILFNKHLPYFGFTDTSIFSLAQRKKCLILTADGPLIQLIQSQGLDVINFKDFQKPIKT